MKTLLPSTFLQRVLLADALTSILVAVLQLALARTMADLLDLPHALLFETGVFLAGYALLLAWLARGKPVPALLLWTLVLGNAGWALGCAVVAAMEGPKVLGLAYLVVQALTVLAFAGLEFTGIRGSLQAGGARMQASVLR